MSRRGFLAAGALALSLLLLAAGCLTGDDSEVTLIGPGHPPDAGDAGDAGEGGDQ